MRRGAAAVASAVSGTRRYASRTTPSSSSSMYLQLVQRGSLGFQNLGPRRSENSAAPTHPCTSHGCANHALTGGMLGWTRGTANEAQRTGTAARASRGARPARPHARGKPRGRARPATPPPTGTDRPCTCSSRCPPCSCARPRRPPRLRSRGTSNFAPSEGVKPLPARAQQPAIQVSACTPAMPACKHAQAHVHPRHSPCLYKNMLSRL